MMRPPGPEPTTPARSTPSSRATRFASGEALMRPSTAGAAATGATTAGWAATGAGAGATGAGAGAGAGCAATGAGAGGGGAAGGAADVAAAAGGSGSSAGGVSPGSRIQARSPCTFTRSPEPAAMPPRMPAAGASTRALILSVSNSRISWPFSTSAPSSTSHSVTAPSSIVIPIRGMRTAVATV